MILSQIKQYKNISNISEMRYFTFGPAKSLNLILDIMAIYKPSNNLCS